MCGAGPISQFLQSLFPPLCFLVSYTFATSFPNVFLSGGGIAKKYFPLLCSGGQRVFFFAAGRLSAVTRYSQFIQQYDVFMYIYCMYYLADGERAALVGWLIGGYSFLCHIFSSFQGPLSLSIYIYNLWSPANYVGGHAVVVTLWRQEQLYNAGKKINLQEFSRELRKRKKKQVSLGVNFKLTN